MFIWRSVAVWIRNSPISSGVWIIGPQFMEPFQKASAVLLQKEHHCLLAMFTALSPTLLSLPVMCNWDVIFQLPVLAACSHASLLEWLCFWSHKQKEILPEVALSHTVLSQQQKVTNLWSIEACILFFFSRQGYKNRGV